VSETVTIRGTEPGGLYLFTSWVFASWVHWVIARSALYTPWRRARCSCSCHTVYSLAMIVSSSHLMISQIRPLAASGNSWLSYWIFEKRLRNNPTVKEEISQPLRCLEQKTVAHVTPYCWQRTRTLCRTEMCKSHSKREPRVPTWISDSESAAQCSPAYDFKAEVTESQGLDSVPCGRIHSVWQERFLNLEQGAAQRTLLWDLCEKERLGLWEDVWKIINLNAWIYYYIQFY
jgi:hypothetical protein